MIAFDKAELPYLHIAFRQDLGVLFCRWQTAVALAQFAEGYMTALEVATQQQVHFWLQDLRLRNVASELEDAWFKSNFVPAAKIALGNSTFIANLMSPQQCEQVLAKALPADDGIVKYGKHLEAGHFISEHDALDWLDKCRFQETFP